MTSRHEVLNALTALFDKPAYLEIGVLEGVTFHQVSAHTKVAVDPAFRFDTAAAAAANPNATYVTAMSDDYFGSIIEPDRKFDVVFLDGLHTAEQTFRDFVNVLSYLSPRGIVVFDDAVPLTFASSLRDARDRDLVAEALDDQANSWMGDVYKLAFVLDTFFQQFSYATTADNHGEFVVWRGRRPAVTERLFRDIGALHFEDVILQKNVMRRVPFATILEWIVAAQG